MKTRFSLYLLFVLLAPLARELPASGDDPFEPFLDGKAPQLLRELPTTATMPQGVALRRVVFRLRDNSEIYAAIATPQWPGKHPGMLVLHGGGGCAEVEKAIAWAQRGYVAVAPDLPGIAEPQKLTDTRGRWNSLKYGEGRYVAKPDVRTSVIFDAVLAAMKSLYLLRAQPDVDPTHIGVVGISWGGYMTTMVCGLAGDQVRAGFAVYGCGFYELTSQLPALMKMEEGERAQWLKYLDAGRRAPGIKGAFFLAGAANDFFYWPPAVQATLDAIPGEKNHLFSPNESHRVSLPGGTLFPRKAAEPFKPTPFQPYPTPTGNKANWLAMEVPFFKYYLEGEGQPLPKVTVQKSTNPLTTRFTVKAPEPIVKAEVCWSSRTQTADWTKHTWRRLPTTKTGSDTYEAELPAAATHGAHWFAVITDARPVTVSSDLMEIKETKH